MRDEDHVIFHQIFLLVLNYLLLICVSSAFGINLFISLMYEEMLDRVWYFPSGFFY